MNHNLWALWAFIALCCYCSAAQGNTIYVSSTASGTQDGSKDHPFATFSQALSAATNGVQIKAYSGTYTGADNYNLKVTDKLSISFYVQGEEEVVIDFEGGSDGFLDVENDGLPFHVERYTFTNQASDSKTPILRFNGTEETLISGCIFKNVGYGLVMNGVTEVDVEGCSFESCVNPLQNGPALLLEDSIGSVTDTTFEGNHGKSGGSIYISSTPQGSIILKNVQAMDSIAEKDGGGLYIDSDSNVTITGGAYSRNTAKEGSGGGIYSASPIVLDSPLIEDNVASLVGGGLALETGVSSSKNIRADSIISTCQINKNTGSLGGGVHLSSLSPVFITGSSFEKNKVQIPSNSATEEVGCGGALFVDKDGDAVTVDNSNFDGNVASARGGAVYISGPSGSALFQMRSNSIVQNNIAHLSGGGIELENPILFASFVDVSIFDNSVEQGDGGGMMLRASSEVFACEIEGNTATNGAGIDIDHAGFVALVDNEIRLNVANQTGGGIRVGLNTGMLLKGGQFITNEAAEGGGAFLSPNLPMDIVSVKFDSNGQGGGQGGSLYLSGTNQEGASGLNLVRVRMCEFVDSLNKAVYSNEGEIVFIETCQIDGLEMVADTSISVCGCPGTASISSLLIQEDSGNFLTDGPFRVASAFEWNGGRIYGVNSTLCMSGLKTGDFAQHYSLDQPLDAELNGNGAIGQQLTDAHLYSKYITWIISKSLNVNVEKLITTGQDIKILNDAILSITAKGAILDVGFVENQGTISLVKSNVIQGTLRNTGKVEIRYTSIPEDADVAQVYHEECLNGDLVVTAPSPSPLQPQDTFPVLKWKSYTGYFRKFELKSDYSEHSRPVLDYKPDELKVIMAHASAGNGGLIAVIIVSILIFIAFAGGCVLSYRLRKQQEEEQWDGPQEETKILGESGVVVEGREEQSLISNEDL